MLRRADVCAAHVKAMSTAVLILVVLTGCGPAKAAPRSGVSALTITETPVPPLPVPNYTTSGTFLQVSKPGSSLARVNAALGKALRDDQQQYATSARQEEADNNSAVFDPGVGAGLYDMYPNAQLMSASTVVVSALVPVDRYYPGGTDSNGWLAVTVLVPSGSVVNLSSIFADPTKALAALAANFKAEVVRSNSCIRAGLADPINGSLNAQDFNPTLANYQYFALTTNGIAVGFPAGQGGSPACGPLQATVPYPALQPYLNDLGKTLVADVRLAAK
jgi:hypothetical protein